MNYAKINTLQDAFEHVEGVLKHFDSQSDKMTLLKGIRISAQDAWQESENDETEETINHGSALVLLAVDTLEKQV